MNTAGAITAGKARGQDTLAELRRQTAEMAHSDLDKAISESLTGDFYGIVGVEVVVQAGRPVTVRRKIESTRMPTVGR